jgi:hypothetical protein
MNGTGIIGTTAPASGTFWAAVAFAFYVTPYVVNIGFTRSWKRRPQFVVAGLAVAAVVADIALYGTWWAPPLGIFMLGWLLYFMGHLGGSFLISSLLATPGCEMRAIPHLWTVVTGRPTKEHYCPGPLDKLDAWERRPAQT